VAVASSRILAGQVADGSGRPSEPRLLLRGGRGRGRLRRAVFAHGA